MSQATSLSSHLLALDPSGVERATQHAFLRSAGSLTISPAKLSAWLTQDRLYAMVGYTKLMGHMLSRLDTPAYPPNHPQMHQWRKTFATLSGALSNIHREINYFESTAAENNLSLSSAPAASSASLGLISPLTNGYVDYMISLSSTGTHAESAVLLWAMEQLYFQAWSYAATFLPASPSAEAEQPGLERAVRSFIHNWTSPEFAQFVQACRDIVDDLPEHHRQGVELERLETVWRTTLWYEERFWDAE